MRVAGVSWRFLTWRRLRERSAGVSQRMTALANKSLMSGSATNTTSTLPCRPSMELPRNRRRVQRALLTHRFPQSKTQRTVLEPESDVPTRHCPTSRFLTLQNVAQEDNETVEVRERSCSGPDYGIDCSVIDRQPLSRFAPIVGYSRKHAANRDIPLIICRRRPLPHLLAAHRLGEP